MSFINRRAAVGAAALALALGACDAGDPVSPAGGAQGQTQPLLAGVTNATKPTGTASVSISEIAIDPSLPDAFGRVAPDRRGRFWSTEGFWRIVDYGRSSLAAERDPRIPVPNTNAAGPGLAIIDIYPPDFAGGYWELYMPGGAGVTGLKPGVEYRMAFVHYRLGVAGAPDQVDRLILGAAVDRDTLKKLTGTEQLAIGEWTSAAPAGCATYPGTTANPLVIAEFTASAGGASPVLDQCIVPGNGLDEETPQAGSLIGANNNTAYDLPNYNYLVIYEAAHGLDSTAWRLQLGQDLDAAGQPIANAFAPFPAPASSNSNKRASSPGHASTDLAASFPLSIAAQVALPAAIGAPDSVRVRMTNVQRLETGVYKAWYVNRNTNEAQPAPGRYIRRSITVNAADTALRDTTIFEDVANTSTFKGGPEEILFTTRPYSEIGNPDLSDTLAFLLITVEQNENAATPSTAQPFWVRVFKTAGTSAGGTVQFGDFNFNQGDAQPVTFTAQGTFSGGVLGGTRTERNGEETEVVFEGSTVRLNFTGLTRPPEGYEYRAYMCMDSCSPLLPASNFLDMGTLSGPGGEDLTQADSPAYTSSNVVGSRITSAFLSFDFAGSGSTVCDYDRFRLALQPKGAVDIPTTYVIDAPLSVTITTAARCE